MKNNQNEYTTLSLAGSLFSADMLFLMARGNSSHQSVEDYKLLPGLRFSDEISRSFNISRAFYNEYKKNRNASSAYDSTKKFIEDFFTKALNYDSFIHSSGMTIKDRKYPVTLYAAKDVPIIIAPYTFTLDEAAGRFAVEGVTSRKKSAFSLAQLFLNASGECTWAFATNGLELRLLRDSDSLVRPSFLSFDIESILSDSRYPDFVALWYLIHSSRVNIWEAWRQEGITNGTRVREGLRDGVTNALLHLGAGFLQTEGEGNNALLNALKDGKQADGVSYTQMDFYKALLREVYRFLFLSTIEERNLLFAHTEDEAQLTPELRKAHRIYREGYSIHRLAEKSRRILSNDKYSDIWHGIQVVFKALQKGNEALDLSPIGGLFRQDQCPLLDACNIDNEHLLKAIRCLRWCYINGKLTFTDYRNMGTEEFGSVYESLLELVPRVDLTAKSFSFVGIGDENGIDEEGSTTGNARKTSGSYYTNAELVNSLINTALIPALETKISTENESALKEKREANIERALLDFTVIDPACGSGHFLLAAARKIAERLVEARYGEEAPNQSEFRKALRDVITNCIYGVDLNEMAIELARTALWLEGYEPGKPLEFLSHHIKCGNSLVGVFDLDSLNKGIPEGAYEPIGDDNKKRCSALKKSNATEVAMLKANTSQGDLFATEIGMSSGPLARLMWDIEHIPNDSIENEEKKAKLYEQLHQNKDYLKNKTLCDLFTSAFFVEKKDDGSLIPTSQDLIDVKNNEGEQNGKKGIRQLADDCSKTNNFFHWRIEFPEVFEKNRGFNCILGNPPWDVSQLNEVEYFSTIMPEIAEMKGNGRKKAIDGLKTQYPDIYKSFIQKKRSLESENSYYSKSLNYPLSAKGKVNLYAIFSELIYKLRGINGTAGFIVPTGLATDDSTKVFFGELSSKGQIKSIYDFENALAIFPNVHRSYKFGLFTLAPKDGFTDFSCWSHDVVDLSDSCRHFSMLPDDFELINPNTHTLPLPRSKYDFDLAKKMYEKTGVFIEEAKSEDEEDINPWGISFKQMYNMTTASNYFEKAPGKSKDGKELLPLYEAKMMHQMDHRWNSFTEPGKVKEISDEEKINVKYSAVPEYWVPYVETVLRTSFYDSKFISPLRDALDKNDATAISKLKNLCIDNGNMCRLNGEEKQQEFWFNLASKKNDELTKAIFELVDNERPRYLMGFRNIARATDSRTFIASVIPFVGVGHSMPVFQTNKSPKYDACLIANFCSLILDYVVRLKLGGTNMTYGYIKQFPILSPESYLESVQNFIVPRVMALTYTANDMTEWAKALWNDSSLKMRLKMLQLNNKENEGITDEKFVDREFSSSFLPPYIYDDAKRAILRAELDAYFARLYGLTRTELQYILDPHSVMGEDYPSETFRVLKDNEIAKYGEYRTQRLVLEAWDRME